jgi:hypothetical protein
VNHTRWVVAVACLAFSLASADGRADSSSGWSLNPFATSTDSKPAASSSSTSSHAIKRPSMWSSSEDKKVKRRSAEPSTWEKLSNGTKSMTKKTTEALGFKDNSTTQKKPASVGNRYGVKKKEPEKKSMFSKMFSSGDDKPKKPQTVSDFLKQDRPQ